MGRFYEGTLSPTPRLGDIVVGFHSALTEIEDLGAAGELGDLAVAIRHPPYLVIMTPCCSIEEGSVVLAPLVRLQQPKLYLNPYFAEDLTRLNRKAKPEQQVPPAHWAKLPPEERQARLAKGEGYTLLQGFIYAPNDLLPKYEIKHKDLPQPITTGHYMVDFKEMFRVECRAIARGRKDLGRLKRLQLSVQSRDELRQKLAYYFSRAPVEDEVELGRR